MISSREDVIRKTRYPYLKEGYLDKIILLDRKLRKSNDYSTPEGKEFIDNPLNLWRHMSGFWKEKDGISRVENVIKKVIKWRNEYKPHRVYKKFRFVDYIRRGKYQALDFCFFSGYDRKSNPVAYLFLDREKEILPRNDERMDFFFDLVCFLMEDAIERLMKTNMDYQITLVIDAKNIGFSHSTMIPRFVKKFLAVSDYYYENLNKAYVVNCKGIVTSLWKICTPFLYKSTVKKYNFWNDSSRLSEFIEEDQIPQRLGGKNKINYSLAKHIRFVHNLKNEEEEKAKKQKEDLEEENEGEEEEEEEEVITST